MAELSRIGIVNMSVDWWTAGASYTRMLVQSLAAATDGKTIELLLLSKKKSAAENDLPAKIRHFKTPHYFPGEKILRHLSGRGEKSELYETAARYRASVLLPVLDIPMPRPPISTVGWIPDFQHRHWPEFYSKASLASRDRAYQALAERAHLVMLSSESAREDFMAFAPAHAAKARVVPFPSLFAFSEPPPHDPREVLARFHLPEKIALVANQFWQHKNHAVVVEAIAQLAARGLRLPVVMTGQPSDFRDAQNKTLSRLLQSISAHGLAGQIVILGQVEFADLVALMRAAAVIIQPSRSEGWSTVVQDAKALGRPLLCSGIAVHRAQAPEALGFFEWDRPAELADLLAAHWEKLPVGPCGAREQAALENERRFAADHGAKLLQVCREAFALRD